MAARGVQRIGRTDLGSLPGVLTSPRNDLEPVFERKGCFSEVFLAKGVLIPGDELDGGEFIDHREIDVEIKGSVLLRKGWVQRLFNNACLVLNGKTRDDKETERGY